MLLRHFRWIGAAAVALGAVCSSPARSAAEVTVVVEELSASNAVLSSSTVSGTPTGSTTFFQSFNFSSSYFTLSGVAGTNSQTGAVNASLSTSFTGGFNSPPNGSFDQNAGHTLKIIVTDNGYAGNGNPTDLLNTAGASQGFANGSIVVSSSSVGLNSTDSSVIAGPTPTATDTITNGAAGGTQQTLSNVSALPSTYGIQQTISISFVPNPGQNIDTASTFAGSAGARIEPNAAVPAPGGLALALIGLPLVGGRRLLRKRAAA
jgi:hypothetical protein